MVFIWQPWNIAHVARHGLSPAEVEAVFAAEDFQALDDPTPGSIRAVGRGTVLGLTYRVVFIQDHQGAIFPITCHREHPGRRFP